VGTKANIPIDESSGDMDLDNDFILAAARAGHEARNAYAAFLGDETPDDWEDLSEDERARTHGLVDVMLRIATTPMLLHEVWSSDMLSRGWTYGESISLTEKKHPNLVMWSDLPVTEANRVRIFVEVVKAFIQAIR
jgi:hypothetical protein